jgi:hypothetical protein
MHEITFRYTLPFHVDDRKTLFEVSVVDVSLISLSEHRYLFYVYRVDLVLCTSTSSIILRKPSHIRFPSSHANNSSLLLAIAQADDSPPAAPSPLPGTAISATTFHGPEFLIFTLRQTNDNVSLDSAE